MEGAVRRQPAALRLAQVGLVRQELRLVTAYATDGVIGHVEDFYFDDEAWVVRYLVVDTGSWLSSRKVLISPMAIGDPNWAEKLAARVDHERAGQKQPRHQHREAGFAATGNTVFRVLRLPVLLGGAGYWGGDMYANLLMPGYGGFGSAQDRLEVQDDAARAEAARMEHEDPHLRSGDAVTHHHLHATDGDIGHVQGMLTDDETWAIRYLIVNTSNWWVGHKVLISPEWIKDVSWDDRTIPIQLTRQAVKEAPRYDPETSLGRSEGARLHDHYGRSGYWQQADIERR